MAGYWKVLGMQKEKLSALMDGETLDSELLNRLSHSPEMQETQEEFTISSVTRCAAIPGEVLHFDISAPRDGAIENEPVHQTLR